MLASQAVLEEHQIAFDAMKGRVTTQELLVTSLEQTPREADLLLMPPKNAIKVQEVRIERANLAIPRLVMRAPADGLVAAIPRRPGEVVAAVPDDEQEQAKDE